jgi:hypothetical protein
MVSILVLSKDEPIAKRKKGGSKKKKIVDDVDEDLISGLAGGDSSDDSTSSSDAEDPKDKDYSDGDNSDGEKDAEDSESVREQTHSQLLLHSSKPKALSANSTALGKICMALLFLPVTSFCVVFVGGVGRLRS